VVTDHLPVSTQTFIDRADLTDVGTAAAQGSSLAALAELEQRLLQRCGVGTWQQLGCPEALSLLQLLAGDSQLLEVVAGGPEGGARAPLQEVLQLAAQAATAAGIQLQQEQQQQLEGAVAAGGDDAQPAQKQQEGAVSDPAGVAASEEQLQAVSAALCSHYAVARVELLGHGGAAALLSACRQHSVVPCHAVRATAALAAGAAPGAPAAGAAELAAAWGGQGPEAAALAALRAAPELCDLSLWCQWEAAFQPALGPLEQFLARAGEQACMPAADASAGMPDLTCACMCACLCAL
jgi:hypothetical protein